MIGLIKLKKQYGAYAKVETPSALAKNAPHVFQGTKTEVTVPVSSRALDRFFAARFRRLNSNLYIRPGSTIAIYWSAAKILTPMHVKAVTNMSEPVVCAIPINPITSLFKSPSFSMIDPKVIAHITSHMVSIIPAIPP